MAPQTCVYSADLPSSPADHSIATVITECGIKFEGILYDMAAGGDGLSTDVRYVRSLGAEGRRESGPQFRPSDKIYESIVFPFDYGIDIKTKSPFSEVLPQSALELAPSMASGDPYLIQSFCGFSPVLDFQSGTLFYQSGGKLVKSVKGVDSSKKSEVVNLDEEDVFAGLEGDGVKEKLLSLTSKAMEIMDKDVSVWKGRYNNLSKLLLCWQTQCVQLEEEKRSLSEKEG